MIAAIHETLRFERRFDAPPARVFGAFADPEARARWGVPSPTVGLVYLATDFRVGGLDVSRCGPMGDLKFLVENRYHDIVDDRRIVSSETVACDGSLLSAALITVEFNPEGKGTRLVVTDQVAAIDGPDMIEGARAGMGAALDNLVREINGEAAPRAEGVRRSAAKIREG